MKFRLSLIVRHEEMPVGAQPSSKNRRDTRSESDSARHARGSVPPSKDKEREEPQDKHKEAKSEKPEKIEKLEKPDKKRESPASAPKTSAELPVVEECQDVSSMSDEDLMKLCQEGDEAAFEVLFQ